LFFFGIVVGAVTLLGLSVLLAGARRTAGRGQDARCAPRRSQRETAFLNRDRHALLEHQRSGADRSLINSEAAATRHNRVPLLGRWSSDRQPAPTPDAGRRS
jgi:hypothetical protein